MRPITQWAFTFLIFEFVSSPQIADSNDSGTNVRILHILAISKYGFTDEKINIPFIHLIKGKDIAYVIPKSYTLFLKSGKNPNFL